VGLGHRAAAYRPLRGSFRLAPLISAIGMSIFLSNFVQVAQGPRNKRSPPMLQRDRPARGRQLRRLDLLQADPDHRRHRDAAGGLLVRGAADLAGPRPARLRAGPEMAALLGVDVDRTISLTFVMGAALAAVAGTLFLIYYGVVSFTDGFVPGVKAFTAAVLGGIGSLPGRCWAAC
jgi:branched-chain amino acid transport system permease protein